MCRIDIVDLSDENFVCSGFVRYHPEIAPQSRLVSGQIAVVFKRIDPLGRNSFLLQNALNILAADPLFQNAPVESDEEAAE